MTTIHDVWKQQAEYNDKVKLRQKRSSAEWMTTYILGVMSEMSELLKEMNWKTHRIQSTIDFGPNVKGELADITKYVFSMWQLMEISPEEMIEEIFNKGRTLEQLYSQENRSPYQDQKVLILDLDGVISDFAGGFKKWLKSNQWAQLLSMGEHEFGIHMDINRKWDFGIYTEAKLNFEEYGGYRKLPPIKNIVIAIQKLKASGWYIIACTSRPYSVYKRIWNDTWNWLLENSILVDELHFRDEDRIGLASGISKYNSVVAIDDNPTIIQRYSSSGIPCVGVRYHYNEFIPHSPSIEWIHRECSPEYIVKQIKNMIKERTFEND